MWFQLVVALAKLVTQTFWLEIWLRGSEGYLRSTQGWVEKYSIFETVLIFCQNGVTSKNLSVFLEAWFFISSVPPCLEVDFHFSSILFPVSFVTWLLTRLSVKVFFRLWGQSSKVAKYAQNTMALKMLNIHRVPFLLKVFCNAMYSKNNPAVSGTDWFYSPSVPLMLWRNY